jgi:hypothetical protein
MPEASPAVKPLTGLKNGKRDEMCGFCEQAVSKPFACLG